MLNGACKSCNYKLSNGLEFELNSNGSTYCLIGMGSCRDTEVCIPSSYADSSGNTFPVTDIKATAFNKNTTVKTIIVPYGVTNISNGAFANCSNLRKVVLPKGLKKLGSSLFQRCYNLEEVNIPSTVESIGHGSFHECSQLKSIVIPDSVKTIVLASFNGCSNLETVVIGNGVESMGDRTFTQCKKLKKLVLGKNVKSIGVNSFTGCTSLKEVHIDSVGAWFNIEMGSLDENNVFQTTDANPLLKGAKLYLNGELLTRLEIPEGILEIKASAFTNYKTFTYIKIPKSVKKIGMLAFTGCEKVEVIEYAGTVDEWLKINKSTAWAGRTIAKKVTCTDGEVQI